MRCRHIGGVLHRQSTGVLLSHGCDGIRIPISLFSSNMSMILVMYRFTHDHGGSGHGNACDHRIDFDRQPAFPSLLLS